MPDAIVIGGGIVGFAAAWELSKSGLDVTVLEAGQTAREASWAGAGMLAPGGEFSERSVWSDFAIESLNLYPEFVRSLESETGVAIDFRQSGAAEIAFDATELDALREKARRQRSFGIENFEVDGAVHYPHDAVVNPRDVCNALKRVVRVTENERVHSIHCADRVRVETETQSWSAGVAILAAGAWSGSIRICIRGARFNPPASFPVRGHLLGYDLPPGSLGPILRSGPTYILQRANGFTIAGSSTERVGFDRRLSSEIVADLETRARRLLPRLENTPVAAAWLGFRPAIEGLHPEIGRVEDSPLWLAYGHYRNGILLAPATAKRLAREITAGR